MSTPTSHPLPPSSPPHLDPPFRGYIATTYDSLLVFEAARRGLIPRVTRRLIERERGMVQSGAVFVFDEQESGIKRWTDGLVWSPSRILGNFLVYRETDKRSVHANSTSSQIDFSNHNSPSGTPIQSMLPPHQVYGDPSQGSGEIPILAQGAIRTRSASEGGMDRQRERQLVGSLTNSYKFREGGLVKKTMSVNIGGYSQHMISYYTVADVMSGKLRTPSSIPELASLEISSDYLEKQNFRFPPVVEVGLDGVSRYRGEAEESTMPDTSTTGFTIHTAPTPTDPFDAYGDSRGSGHTRGYTHPQHTPMSIQSPHSPLPPTAYLPNSAGSHYFDHNYPGPSAPGSAGAQAIPIQRQASGGVYRPSSSKARYDPYGSGSPRVASLGHSAGHPHHYGPASAGMPASAGSSLGLGPGPNAPAMYRRQSVPQPPSHQHEYHNQQLHPHPHHQHPHQHQHHHPQQQHDYYQQYDVKPTLHPSGIASYSYPPPPATAPSSFSNYYHQLPPAPTQMASPMIAYTSGPAPAGHGPDHAHHPASAGGYPGQMWQTTSTSSAPPPGTQSRLLPTQSREYGHPPSAEQRPAGGEFGAGGQPPSSSGSGASGASQQPGGAPPYGGAAGQLGSSTGSGGWGGSIPTALNLNRSRLGPGATGGNISPLQSPLSATAIGHLSSPVPLSAARPVSSGGVGMATGIGSMDVGQFIPEDGWSNSTPA